MHTIALASNGSMYSWGVNDVCTLGRKGAENVPMKVDTDFRATGICAGDTHSIAYNTKSNQVYYWGCYTVSNFFLFYSFFGINHTNWILTNQGLTWRRFIYVRLSFKPNYLRYWGSKNFKDPNQSVNGWKSIFWSFCWLIYQPFLI